MPGAPWEPCVGKVSLSTNDNDIMLLSYFRVLPLLELYFVSVMGFV